MLKKFKSASEFDRQVGRLEKDDLDDLNIPVTPFLFTGIFDWSQRLNLLKFCEQNPNYHIATGFSPWVKINRFIDNGHLYYLCDGDNDPELALIGKTTWDHYNDSRIFELWEDERRTTRAELEECFKTYHLKARPKVFIK